MSVKREILHLVRGARYALRFCGRPIRVHPSTWISPRAVFRVCGGGSITIGRNCEIHPFAMLLTYGGDIHIGDDCSVNPFTIIYGHGGVRIGDGTRIAAHTVVIPGNHTPGTDIQAVKDAPVISRGIVIGRNVWIGAGSRILDGVEIGPNAVVGAGSVVTRPVPAGVTVAGVPARLLGPDR